MFQSFEKNLYKYKKINDQSLEITNYKITKLHD
jgi:hypothetical protein